MGSPRPERLRGSEDDGAVVGDGDRVLEVGGTAPVCGDHGPPVAPQQGTWASCDHDRLDSDAETAADPHTGTTTAVAGNRRILVHGPTDAVTRVLAHDVETGGLRTCLHRVADIAADPQYQARRAEVYGSLNDWLETGAIPPEDTLVEELTAVRTSYTNELKLKLESKRELVARLGRSPDHADALALSTWEDQPDTCIAGELEWDSGLIAARGRR